MTRNYRSFSAQTAPDYDYNGGAPQEDLYRYEPAAWGVGPDTAFSTPIVGDKPVPIVANITEVDFAEAASRHAPTGP